MAVFATQRKLTHDRHENATAQYSLSAFACNRHWHRRALALVQTCGVGSERSLPADDKHEENVLPTASGTRFGAFSGGGVTGASQVYIHFGSLVPLSLANGRFRMGGRQTGSACTRRAAVVLVGACADTLLDADSGDGCGATGVASPKNAAACRSVGGSLRELWL